MLKNYLKLAFRKLSKQKRIVVFNIIGLSFGMAFSILILLLIDYELSFDSFHKNKGEIYRVLLKQKQSNELYAYNPLPTPDILCRDYPEIKYVSSFWKCIEILKLPNKELFQCTGYSVEPDVFNMFGFSLITGNLQHVFDDPYSAVITESFAKKVFGNTDVINKTFQSDDYTFTIKGIVKDFPSNSIFDFDLLVSNKLRYVEYPNWADRWWHGGIYTFIVFHNKESAGSFNEKLARIEETYFPDYLKGDSEFIIQPFKGSHTDGIIGDLKPNVSKKYLYILLSIALAVLLIACINFINMATSLSRKSLKETGIRKVSGAGRKQLSLQYLSESFMWVVIALFFSLIIVELALPKFNTLVEKNILLNFSDLKIMLGILGCSLLTGLIVGIYPGVYLSKFSPVQAIYSRVKMGEKSFRKSFVITQLVITTLLIFSEVMIMKQVAFMKNYDVGFDNKNLLSINLYTLNMESRDRNDKAEILNREIAKYSAQYGIGKGSITENIPGYYFQNHFKIIPEGYKAGESLKITSTVVDENFLETFGQKMVEGRFFSIDIQSDRNAFLINETAMKQFGWQNSEGKSILLDYEGEKYPVLGVVKDIHINSLQHEKEALLYRFGNHNNYPGYITFRVNEEREKETVEFLKNQWKSLFPEIPFISFWVEDKYLERYGQEEKLSKVVGYFSLLAIVLSCLGLFALISFITEQRTKEIGIRKVNGATIKNILIMLNTNLVKWVLTAYIIAFPIAYYAMNKWLQNFAYRKEMSWWIFALAGGIALAIALLTVSWQSWRAAGRNPVECLRYE